MRNYKETIDWLNSHRTAAQLGFNPDRQCLNICRSARGLPAKYPSAKKAQDATPTAHRVYHVKELRRGMVLYFDDPNDSNKFGHIVTMIGRVKGGNLESLHDVLVVTNSVQRGQLTVVRGDYFPQHWGDKFQFGATSLNDQPIDYAGYKTEVDRFDDDRPRYSVGLLDAAANKGRSDARKARDQIDKLVKSLPDDGEDTRVSRFKSDYKTTRILRMGLLSEAVHTGGREGQVKDVFDKLTETIKDLPSH